MTFLDFRAEDSYIMERYSWKRDSLRLSKGRKESASLKGGIYHGEGLDDPG
jgi:hypothetical protein